MKNLLVKDATLVRSTTTETVDVLVEDGAIARMESHDSPTYSAPPAPDDPAAVVEAEGWLLFPGLIDCHVHFREPGLTHKGDMETESCAAAAGGVTTVCDMPNTVPPTVTVDALRDKVERAKRIKGVDIRFFFGATEEGHLEDLRRLFTDASLKALRARCCGLKLFLDHSTGNQRISGELLEEAFRLCAGLGIPVMCHCEDAAINEEAAARVRGGDVAVHSLMRPPESEERAVATVIALARKTGARIHPTHLSTARGVALVRQAKKDGLSVTCDVAPHHLFLTIDDYAAKGTLAKMNPPVRSMQDRDALWEAVADGTVDCIATDHAPHTFEEKRNPDPLKAPSGVPGVETMLPLLLTVAAGGWPHPASERPGMSLAYEDIARLCFHNPNRIFSLGKRDAREGAPADLLLVDPGKKGVIEGKKLHSPCGWTPYEGWKVIGSVKRVIH